MLLLLWIVIMFQMGAASMAHADDLFIGPYDTDSSVLTPFERYDTGNYSFLYAPDSNNDGLAGTFDAGLAAITDALFFLGASIVRGALLAMQWMLGLDLYADNADTVDSAVVNIAENLMLPLMGITLVIAGFAAYARYRRESGESIINDVAWIAAGGILAAAFALTPSTFIGLADGARGAVGSLVMKTYGATVGGNDENVLGVNDGADDAGSGACPPHMECPEVVTMNASRELVNGLWDAWVSTPWCVAQYRHLDTCAKEDPNYGASNAEVLLDPTQRADLEKKLATEYSDISDGDTYAAWDGNDRWIRGMLGGRLGVVLIFFIVSIPMALFILGLTLFGLMATVGLLLMVLVGPFFLALWVIPGAPRRAGLQWLTGLIALLLQSILITLTIGAIAITTSIINANLDEYGYFICGLLNIVVLVVAWKLRTTMENFGVAGSGSAAAGGMVGGGISSYTAWRTMGSAGRMARRAGRGAARPLAQAGSAIDRASGGSGRGPLRRAAAGGRAGPSHSRPLTSMDSTSPAASIAPLPPRPSGRAGSYANTGVPMSAGEYRREKQARVRDDRRGERRTAVREAVRPSPDGRAGRTLAAVQERRASKPPTMTFDEHVKHEKENPSAYRAPREQRQHRRRPDLPSMKDAKTPPRQPAAASPVVVQERTRRRSRRNKP